MKNVRIVIGYALIAILFLGCSNARKSELTSGSDPHKAIIEVTQLKQEALNSQVDVLADSQFNSGNTHLTYARDDLKSGLSVESVLENAAIAKGYFEDATETAKLRRSNATRILDARNAALLAGLRNSASLVTDMQGVDDDLKAETEHFSHPLAPEEFSEFQKKYLSLEVRAVQFRELNSAKEAINKATINDAKDLAPNALRTAQLNYSDAENTIAQNPRSPENYQQNVQTALESAMMLQDVLDVILGAKGTPEHIAAQIVTQKRALGELTGNVGRLKANLQSTQLNLQEKEGALKQKESELKQTEGVLKSQQEQLARASTQVRFQQAMDEARKVLPQSDALVYQQGNTLVFRMKRINFKSGTAIIPETSKSLLTKVNTIISKLDAEQVIVQGHTDSVGPADVNLKLSEERAVSVANYLVSLSGGYAIVYTGYGENNPIASNETAEGRATNRRVDLVVSVKQ